MSARFQNRLPPEGINVGTTNPLLEFMATLIGFVLTVCSLALFLYLGGALLARHIPFSWEDRIADTMFASIKNRDEAASARLQALADKLSADLILPEGMHFTVSYIHDDDVNAYATLGGRIMLHSALVERLHSENALAMVLAHEMAHVIHRDPADAMGGRLALAIAAGIFSSAIGADALENMVGGAQQLVLLPFSRAAEKEADTAGLALVARHYGHLGGADEVFRELAAYEGQFPLLATPELLSTHPDILSRVQNVANEAERLHIPASGKLTPLPPGLRTAAE